MSRIIESLESLDVDWLAQAISRPASSIASFKITKSWETPLTQVALIGLGYGGASEASPSSVFLKIPKKGQSKDLRLMCARGYSIGRTG